MSETERMGWTEFARRQADMGDVQVLSSIRVLRRAQKEKDWDLIPAVLEFLSRAHVHLFEIHTGTGNA